MRKKAVVGASAEPSSESENSDSAATLYSQTWAMLIKRVYEADPLSYNDQFKLVTSGLVLEIKFPISHNQHEMHWRTSMTRNVTGLGFALLAIALTSGNTALSQDANDAPQSWVGTLDVGAAKLRLRFDIEKDDAGNLKCTMISIDQGNAKIPMDSCTIDDGRLKITSDKLKVVYQGAYKNRNTPIAGKFTQSGQSFDLTLKAAEPAQPTKHIETWQGTMKAGGRSFEFQFRLLETKDKKRQVELDSFSESIGGLSVKPTFKDDGVTFEITVTKAKFEGKYNEDKTRIDGHWLQGGGKFPLILKKVPLADTRAVKPKR